MSSQSNKSSVSKTNNGVSMKKSNFGLTVEQKAEISKWYADNAELIKAEGLEEIADTHYSFEEAEAIRLNFYEADSMRRTKRQSTEVEVEEVISFGEGVNFDDLDEANEADEDIYDMGGAEFYVAQQHKAAIQCGDTDRITKRSSVYEDGGDVGLVRVVTDNANEVLFMNQVEADSYNYKQELYTKALVAEMKLKFEARRKDEVEMVEFAMAAYANIAALIVDEESAIKYGEGTYVLVRNALKEKFGKEYIYKYCRYVRGGVKYATFDTFFHKYMAAKVIAPVVKVLVADKRKNAYLALKKLLDSVPANNEGHLARLIKDNHKQIGIDRSRLNDALGYAWDNGEFFAGPIYGALKALAA